MAGVERLLRKTSLLNNSAVSRRPISAPPQLSANHSADPHQSHTACRQLVCIVVVVVVVAVAVAVAVVVAAAAVSVLPDSLACGAVV